MAGKIPELRGEAEAVPGPPLDQEKLHFFFTKSRKKILKCVFNHKRFQRAKVILRKNNVGGIKFPDFRPHYKALVIRAAGCWRKSSHTDQRTRQRPRENRTCLKSSSILQGSWEPSMRKWWPLQQRCYENSASTCRRVKLNSFHMQN